MDERTDGRSDHYMPPASLNDAGGIKIFKSIEFITGNMHTKFEKYVSNGYAFSRA